MDTSSIEKLMIAIVSWAVEQGSYITKTKLLKLLYLFDVEYYRVHRRTFTGFSWKFFHLGPWEAEYDPTLDGLVTKAALLQQCSNAGFETILYKPVWRLDPGELFCNLMDDNILRGVLKTWGTSATGEILDFVYFQTQPMEAGIRNAPLDFSVIQSEKPSAYSKSSSGKSQAEIQRLRTKFEDRQSQRKSARNQPFEFTPPKYDEEYFNAMTKLEML